MSSISDVRRRFHQLHTDGFFVIPNPFDVGSARLLQAAGAAAIATTSTGLAATAGRGDDDTTREQLAVHVRAMTAGVHIPVNVDSQCLFPDEHGGIEAAVDLFAEAGAAGLSIEDYDPAAGGVISAAEAADRVGRAAQAAHRHDIVLTARSENFLHGHPHIQDTLKRLAAYRDAGADVLYAPGLTSEDDIRSVVDLGRPVNVLALPACPPIARLRELGVRRVSTGGALTWATYAAFADAARALIEQGSTGYLGHGLDAEQRRALEG